MTFEPGTPVEHPQHVHGIVVAVDEGIAVEYAHFDLGIACQTSNLTGWERARIAGPGEVVVKVDDLEMTSFGVTTKATWDAWSKEDENHYSNNFKKVFIRAAKAWTELQKDESKLPTGLHRDDDAESELAESPQKYEQPKRVKDREGDVWERRDDGKYEYRDFLGFTYSELERSYGQLTALDDEPATCLGQGNSTTFLAVDETSPVGDYAQHDAVNHPSHYTSSPAICECGKPIECIQITEHQGFNLGNATKYIWRADLKGDAVEDLRKAVWYLKREIEKRSK